MDQPTAVGTVAVIVRTRDRPHFLARALGSVLDQTFTAFAVVVVNDGGNASEVDEVVQRCGGPAVGKITVVHHPVSIGLEAASNAGIRSSRSRYIALHDDDDTWAPSFLAEMVGYLERTGEMGAIATTDAIIERVDDGRLTTLRRERLYPGLELIGLYGMCFENYATPISFVYRRAALDTVGYYDETLESTGDWDFGLRFLMRYEIGFVKTPEALAFYHHRPDADGTTLNHVYSNLHTYYRSLLPNRYLRRDLESGSFGLGTIMSSVRYEDDRYRGFNARLEESNESAAARLEQVEARLAARLEENTESIASRLEVVEARLAALEQAIAASTSTSLVESLREVVARRSRGD
jgi:glycosyltransferase involved in cell wall biosynthesis